MLKFNQTKDSGKRFESRVKSVVESYTKFVYTNVKIDTLFTQNGFTEVDVLAAFGDCLLVLEAKNVCSIQGSPSDMTWEMCGSVSAQDYTALNVFMQNRIHVKSLKDYWYVTNLEMPKVCSLVIVPDDCNVSDELRVATVTLSELNTQIAELHITGQPKYGYQLDYLISKGNNCLHRSDW